MRLCQSTLFGNRRRLVERRSALLVRHFEEKQKRQLLEIVAVRQPVIAQNVAVVPKFLDELSGLLGHIGSGVRPDVNQSLSG